MAMLRINAVEDLGGDTIHFHRVAFHDAEGDRPSIVHAYEVWEQSDFARTGEPSRVQSLDAGRYRRNPSRDPMFNDGRPLSS